jgi:hypothetical protein
MARAQQLGWFFFGAIECVAYGLGVMWATGLKRSHVGIWHWFMLLQAGGMETGALNRAVKRNIERFPADFMLQLTPEEWEDLKCQIGISSSLVAATKVKKAGAIRSQVVTASAHGGRRAIPYAFTEQGIAMLSSVLRSQRAVEVNITIMRTFVQLRRLMVSNRDLARRVQAMENRYDEQFSQVFDAIKQLISEDKTRKAKRSFGFF